MGFRDHLNTPEGLADAHAIYQGRDFPPSMAGFIEGRSLWGLEEIVFELQQQVQTLSPTSEAGAAAKRLLQEATKQ